MTALQPLHRLAAGLPLGARLRLYGLTPRYTLVWAAPPVEPFKNVTVAMVIETFAM
jgi:hypothetical protein